MSFKFNFNVETPVSEDSLKQTCPIDNTESKAKFIDIGKSHLQLASDAKVCEMRFGSQVVKYVSSQGIEDQLKRTVGSTSLAMRNLSDLIPNVYEGGLKIWECSIDLTRFLKESETDFKGMNILEIGCGVGLPALFAYTCGASSCFQDFNGEVLDLVTIPNVILNSTGSMQGQENRCRFIVGDWASVPQVLHTLPKFDIILTSETIYNENSWKKLLDLMKFALKPSGIIYLAAKTCYFGVGGSLRQFEDRLTEDGMFEFKTVWKTEEGVQREIVCLNFKSQ